MCQMTLIKYPWLRPVSFAHWRHITQRFLHKLSQKHVINKYLGYFYSGKYIFCKSF